MPQMKLEGESLRRVLKEITETNEILIPLRTRLSDLAPRPLPKLKVWPLRALCAMRGHSSMLNYPGTTFYRYEGLCEACGARITRNY